MVLHVSLDSKFIIISIQFSLNIKTSFNISNMYTYFLTLFDPLALNYELLQPG